MPLFSGPLSCRWGDFVISIKSNEEDPYNIPSIWKEFEVERSSWQNNTHLRVQCADDSIYETRMLLVFLKELLKFA